MSDHDAAMTRQTAVESLRHGVMMADGQVRRTDGETDRQTDGSERATGCRRTDGRLWWGPLGIVHGSKEREGQKDRQTVSRQQTDRQAEWADGD